MLGASPRSKGNRLVVERFEDCETGFRAGEEVGDGGLPFEWKGGQELEKLVWQVGEMRISSFDGVLPRNDAAFEQGSDRSGLSREALAEAKILDLLPKLIG